MINRFRKALLEAAGVEGVVDSSPQAPSNSSTISNGTSSSSPNTARRQSSAKREGNKKGVKYEYSRPHFLKLTTPDEIQVSADHGVRPILVPRDLSCLPWTSGYAETINSGKSKRNEDQARVHSGSIKVKIEKDDNETIISDSLNANEAQFIDIPYHYFGLFDGHAGSGAAVAASTQLHHIIHNKLMEISNHLIDKGPFCESSIRGKNKGILWFPQTAITKDSLIVGALEAAFEQMDNQIERENKLYDGVAGGCTVVVSLFILGKIFIANAGDSRAILCRRSLPPLPLSYDFTPESERARVRQLAAENPHLLGTEFTALEYVRRPVRKDIGTKILYRGGEMTGWAYKIATEEDLKFPVVFGYGKRSRVLATIGVTRGFGDHDLSAHGSSIRIKPFLKSQPEVRILDMSDLFCGEDDVIVMGTDGLWDVTPNETAASIVFANLDQFPTSEEVMGSKYRFISAAQDLVMHARGKFSENRNWKMSDGSCATIDDISVFVIPIWPYFQEIRGSSSNGVMEVSDLQEDKINDNQI